MKNSWLDEELLALHLQAVLASHEGEARAQFEQEALEVGDQGFLEPAFVHLGPQVEELQVVGVLGHLLDELGVAGWQRGGEVGRRRAGSPVQLAHDLVDQHVSGPAVGYGLVGVPFPQGLVIEPVQEDRDMAPGQLCNSLLHPFWPCLGQGPHIEKVAARRAFHLRELCSEVSRKALDNLGPPALGLLAFQYQPAEAPVQADHLRVHRQVCPQPSRAHRSLGFGQQRGIALGSDVDVHAPILHSPRDHVVARPGVRVHRGPNPGSSSWRRASRWLAASRFPGGGRWHPADRGQGLGPLGLVSARNISSGRSTGSRTLPNTTATSRLVPCQGHLGPWEIEAAGRSLHLQGVYQHLFHLPAAFAVVVNAPGRLQDGRGVDP